MNNSIKKKIDFILDFESKRKIIKSIILNLFISILDILSIGSILTLLYAIQDEKNIIFIQELRRSYPFINDNYFLLLIIVIFLLFLLKFIFSLIVNYKINSYIFYIFDFLTLKFINFYLKKDFNFFFKKNSSEITRNIYSEVGIFVDQVLQNFILLTKDLIIIVFFGIFLLIFDTFSTLVILISLLIVSLTYFYLFKNFLFKVGKDIKNERFVFLKDLSEIFKGIKEIKIFGLENFFFQKFKKNFFFFSKHMKTSRVFSNIPRISLEFFIIIFLLVLVVLFNMSDGSKENILLKLGVFVVAIIKMAPPIASVSQKVQTINLYVASIDNIFNELNSLSTNDKKIKNTFNIENEIKIIESIELKNIDFNYTKNKKIFSDLNIFLEKNNLIGIKGESGSGKTTFTDLISGILSPEKGKIIINRKIDLSEIKLTWKKSIGYVTQSNFLFDESILYNVTLDSSLIDINKDKINLIEEIFKKVKLFDYVKSLPEGMNTKIGENGVSLSGGLKQRLVIARSLYRNPKILILDEATNSLDEKNEEAIIKILNEIKNNMIVILITHQDNLLNYCDKKFLLKNEKLIEIGKNNLSN